MNSERKLLVVLTRSINDSLSALKIAHDKLRKIHKKPLKKADVFAESFSEI
jgi:hypothetical protein